MAYRAYAWSDSTAGRSPVVVRDATHAAVKAFFSAVAASASACASSTCCPPKNATDRMLAFALATVDWRCSSEMGHVVDGATMGSWAGISEQIAADAWRVVASRCGSQFSNAQCDHSDYHGKAVPLYVKNDPLFCKSHRSITSSMPSTLCCGVSGDGRAASSVATPAWYWSYRSVCTAPGCMQATTTPRWRRSAARLRPTMLAATLLIRYPYIPPVCTELSDAIREVTINTLLPSRSHECRAEAALSGPHALT